VTDRTAIPPTAADAGLVDQLEAAWERSDRLFEAVGDAWLERPIPLRHPFLFYLGHLPAFGWNQVGRGVLGRGPVDAELDVLFERGIDPLDEDAAAEQSIGSWPTLERVVAYRDRVREALRAAVPDVRARAGEDSLAEDLRIYAVVLEHEQMHHETLLYLIEELGAGKSSPPADRPELVTGPAPAPERVAIPGGRAVIGADRERLSFGWDNEFPAREVDVAGFEVDRFPVTVAAYREFVEAGGYDDERWWTPEDVAWLRAHGVRHPHRWRREGGAWIRRTTFGQVPLDDVGGWPVIVTCAEADAYARWAGARLPSEAELTLCAFGAGAERAFPWGSGWPELHHGNFGLKQFDPMPVDAHPAGASPQGVEDLVGNGWEWTATDFGPYPGFEPWIRTYPGYSADFFDGAHRVLFGGAWGTHPRLLRRSFRNWFHRHYPWASTTFRLVRSS
jgi:ergothioneine biosynthesis protein EgtB